MRLGTSRSGLAGLALLAALVLSGCESRTDAARTGARRAGEGSGGRVASGGACPAIEGENVRFIVPFTPGGGYDVYARLLEPHLEDALAIEIRVQNRVGAGGRVGARSIRDAAPDGRTLGIVNAPSLLVSGFSSEVSGLHPVDDFTALGRIAYPAPVWATRSGSDLHDLQALLEAGAREPILFGITDVGSTGFLSVSVAAEVLGLRLAYLPGYPGSRENSLGLIRGEFDLGGYTFESILDRVEAGDLEPILQVSDVPLSDHPALDGVPLLAGPEGVAARAARERGRDPTRAIARTDAVAGLFQAGRLVVAPPGFPPRLATCLSDALADVSRDSVFLAAAGRARRSISFAEPADVRERLEATAAERSALAPILRRHIEKARGGPGS